MELMRMFKYLGLALVIALMLAAIVPAAAAPGATITSIAVNVDACRMTVTFTVTDEGTYYLNAWDDGTFKAGAGVHVPANGTGVATLTIGPVLQVAAGIGLYVENGLGLAATTTFDSRGSFQPNAPACVGAWTVSASLPYGNCTNPQPLDFVIRPVPNGAPAFFAAETDKTTDFSLPAGTWYTSPEPTNGFYQVWIACEASPIFIPAEAVG
jgi:hypothetical protein